MEGGTAPGTLKLKIINLPLRKSSSQVCLCQHITHLCSALPFFPPRMEFRECTVSEQESLCSLETRNSLPACLKEKQQQQQKRVQMFPSIPF